jgi:hypothetical protein
MPETDRDRSLIEHLMTKVLGSRYRKEFGMPYFNLDLNSWADAGMVWERAREMGHEIMLVGVPLESWMAGQPMSDEPEIHDSGPRAICEAVARATGWEPKE